MTKIQKKSEYARTGTQEVIEKHIDNSVNIYRRAPDLYT